MPVHKKILEGSKKIAFKMGRDMVQGLIKKGLSEYAARTMVRKQHATILERAEEHMRACAGGCLKEVAEKMNLETEERPQKKAK